MKINDFKRLRNESHINMIFLVSRHGHMIAPGGAVSENKMKNETRQPRMS